MTIPTDTPCKDCFTTGLTVARRWLQHLAEQLIGLVDDPDATARGLGILTGERLGRPGPDMAALADGLIGVRSPYGGAIDVYGATITIIRAAGLDPDTWGICTTCGGKGETSQ
jgi:hypothetical protein